MGILMQHAPRKIVDPRDDQYTDPDPCRLDMSLDRQIALNAQIVEHDYFTSERHPHVKDVILRLDLAY